MAENYDMDALFHPKVEISTPKNSNPLEYSPSADKGKNGIYQSVIRFVSWWQDPQHSYSEKWTCWLVDPVTNRGRSIDCPTTVGKPSPLQDMYFKFKNSESVQEQKKKDIFSRKRQYTAIIQVIKDEQNKELEGKLLTWTFGKKVFDKYEAEKKPIIGEAHEAFDLLDGKAFLLNITKVSGYNNYDQSKFLDQKIPLLISVNNKLTPIDQNTPREVVLNFLKENSPDLSIYGYKEWNQEIYNYVNQVITAVSGSPIASNNYANVRNNVNNVNNISFSKDVPINSTPTSGISTQELSIDDIQFDGGSGIPSLDLPDLNISNFNGISGNLDDALKNL